MKLDKKECRKYADPELTISPDHGLLHAPQVSYIVRTAIKTIDHHRVLVLYIYSREQAAQGDCQPLWTVFQGRDDYITLARSPDGTTKWRTAAFEKLGDDYFFVDKCAFYSAKDQQRFPQIFLLEWQRTAVPLHLSEAEQAVLWNTVPYPGSPRAYGPSRRYGHSR